MHLHQQHLVGVSILAQKCILAGEKKTKPELDPLRQTAAENPAELKVRSWTMFSQNPPSSRVLESECDYTTIFLPHYNQADFSALSSCWESWGHSVKETVWLCASPLRRSTVTAASGTKPGKAWLYLYISVLTRRNAGWYISVLVLFCSFQTLLNREWVSVKVKVE